jgi:serine/threonine protein kinase
MPHRLAGRPPYDRRDLDVYAPRDDRRPSFTTLPEGTSAGGTWFPVGPRLQPVDPFFAALDVLTKLVVRDPNCRVSASQIADHPWFSRQVASFPSEQHVEHLLYESIMTHPSYV